VKNPIQESAMNISTTRERISLPLLINFQAGLVTMDGQPC